MSIAFERKSGRLPVGRCLFQPIGLQRSECRAGAKSKDWILRERFESARPEVVELLQCVARRRCVDDRVRRAAHVLAVLEDGRRAAAARVSERSCRTGSTGSRCLTAMVTSWKCTTGTSSSRSASRPARLARSSARRRTGSRTRRSFAGSSSTSSTRRRGPRSTPISRATRTRGCCRRARRIRSRARASTSRRER